MGGLLEWQALVEVVSVGLLANWLTEISDEYWTLDRVCVSLNVLLLAGFFSFPRAKPAGREGRLARTEEERGVGEAQDPAHLTLWASVRKHL